MTTEYAVSVNEAARRLAVTPQTLRRRIADGTLPSIRFGGRRLVPSWALAALLAPPGAAPSKAAEARRGA